MINSQHTLKLVQLDIFLNCIIFNGIFKTRYNGREIREGKKNMFDVEVFIVHLKQSPR